MLNERLKWRVFPTVFKYSRKHLEKWLKPLLLKSQVDTHLRMIHARTNLQILNYEVSFLQSSVDCARRIRRWNPRRRTIWQVCALLNTKCDAGLYTLIKPRRSSCRASPSSVDSMSSGHPGPGSIAGSSGRKGASKALSSAFGDDHAMVNLRT